ncbi:hypothetical protein BC938DRAFT_479391 [Jimgerdemannia flammicorona]|uniref:Uncharacterized protein n=1 Tax=Jimgerdemannia flammicorona TaxID=994334 RepID=A0A433QKX4_9FUNG|nr:hypothetical protein BC938DRAFT_479391 [Jimgerdemannia flammicorona]
MPATPPVASNLPFYSKIFGVGFVMGGAIEVLLVKSNYYQLIAKSEAKERAKKQARKSEGEQADEAAKAGK